ncbi:MAG: secretion protein [Flavobacterium sp. BFFFF2]|nr:MAG: secretion protein [Flavobacterium sp. BFFFF2]
MKFKLLGYFSNGFPFVNNMKKLVFSQLLFLIPLLGLAQLYSGNATYLYNNGALLFVNKEVNLSSGSKLYLRNEGQLIQGTATTSTNTGSGILSVFQEGTSDNYDYNYWCAPVGNASGTVGNENFGISQLYQPTTNIASTAATLLAASSLDGVSNPLSIASYWIWKFQTSGTYADWAYVGTASSLAAGQGFTMKGSSGTDATNVGETATNNPGGAQRYDFRGKPNDGTIGVNVSAGNYTLTGNPYPSALHVNAFLLDAANTACTGIAYYWEQDKTANSHSLLAGRGGYGTFAPVSTSSAGIYTPAVYYNYYSDGSINFGTGSNSTLSIVRKYAPIGQGFMVEGTTTGSINLKNSHRAYYKESNVGHQSQFEKNSRDNFPILWLDVQYNQQITRQLALGFPDFSTDDIDHGMDAKDPTDTDAPFDGFFVLNSTPYVIQCLPFAIEKRIPLGVRVASEGLVRFSIRLRDHFNQNQEVFIFDTLTQTYHPLTDDSFFEVLLPAGAYNRRFQLTFQNPLLANNHGEMAGFFSLSHQPKTQLLSIYNPSQQAIAAITIYDITGKKINQNNQTNTERLTTFDTSTWATGAYLVYIELQDGQHATLKIMITPKN